MAAGSPAEVTATDPGTGAGRLGLGYATDTSRMVTTAGEEDDRYMPGVGQTTTAWLGRHASIALLVAGVWAAGIIAAGFLVPMYRTMGESTSGEITHGTDTLVGVNGPGVVVVLAVPLVVTVLVGSALLLRAHRWALPVAWTLTALLAGFTLLAMMSIGVFIIPVAVALVIACANTAADR